MNTTLQTLSGVDAFLAAYKLRKEAFTSAEPPWLSAQRQQAIESFQDSGFPTVADEEWRYTNVSPIVSTEFQITPQAASVAAPPFKDDAAVNCLVFVNGQYDQQLSKTSSLPSGVLIGSLRTLLSDPKASDVLRVYLGRTLQAGAHGFTHLNAALWQDGPCVIVPAGVALEKPVYLMNLVRADGAPLVCHPRTLIICERGSQATIVETFQSVEEGVGFSNAVTEVVAGENSVVDLYKSVQCNQRSFHIGLLQVYAARDSRISALSASLGGDLVRNETHVVLDAEGADCTLNGLYAAKGVQHVDNHTTIDHAKPHCASRQFYNGILDGHATGVFNGRVIVRPNAQKTDAVQKNRNLLLSTDATIDTKPQLEISANDVRCTHGATVGQMDAEALFFLRSRGLERADAVAMLVQAFASEILDKVAATEFRNWLTGRLVEQLLGRASGNNK